MALVCLSGRAARGGRRRRARRIRRETRTLNPGEQAAPHPSSIIQLLTAAVANGASDLHLKVGSGPMMRLNGLLVPMPGEPSLQPADTDAMATALMQPEHAAKFRQSQEVDLAYGIAGIGRFRVNVFRQRGTVGIVLRVIPFSIPSIDDLGLPAIVKQIASEERGLILVTGTTGSGKSTTLAAIIDHINATRRAHIITIEDPIEYLHRDRLSIVNQREIAVDTASFATALRGALRQDPDVILMGEMRDMETVETALVASETGHLVLSTLHTLDATETINRIVAIFPPHHQRQIRLQLASVLKAVISQRLVPHADGQHRVAAVEVMLNTAFIRDCIIDQDRTALVNGAIAAGASEYGMQSFDQSIYKSYEQGLLTLEEALRWATNPAELRMRSQGIVAGGGRVDVTSSQGAQSGTSVYRTT